MIDEATLAELEARTKYYAGLSDYFDGPILCSELFALLAAAREAARLKSLMREWSDALDDDELTGYHDDDKAKTSRARAKALSAVLDEARRIAKEREDAENF